MSRPVSAITPRASGVGTFSQRRRLEFIDFRLRWDGRLNRADLTDFFGISVPQASLDIARYGELADGNIEYDASARVYVSTPQFRPAFASSSPVRFLNELLARASGNEEAEERSFLRYWPPVAMVPSPGRLMNADVLVALQRAIREETGVRVVYQSFSRPQPSERALSPHAFSHDGTRWHARAYCHERGEFRDFVIARILELRGVLPAAKTGADDLAWNTDVTLLLAPHPKLSPAHRRAVELDYGMVGGQVAFSCREALLFYVLRHLRLDSEARTPEAQQIILKNASEIAKRHPGVALDQRRAGADG